MSEVVTPGMRVGGLIFFAESVEASIALGKARAIRFGGVINQSMNEGQACVGDIYSVEGRITRPSILFLV
jgi:hypothetical protein